MIYGIKSLNEPSGTARSFITTNEYGVPERGFLPEMFSELARAQAVLARCPEQWNCAIVKLAISWSIPR